MSALLSSAAVAASSSLLSGASRRRRRTSSRASSGGSSLELSIGDVVTESARENLKNLLLVAYATGWLRDGDGSGEGESGGGREGDGGGKGGGWLWELSWTALRDVCPDVAAELEVTFPPEAVPPAQSDEGEEATRGETMTSRWEPSGGGVRDERSGGVGGGLEVKSEVIAEGEPERVTASGLVSMAGEGLELSATEEVLSATGVELSAMREVLSATGVELSATAEEPSAAAAELSSSSSTAQHESGAETTLPLERSQGDGGAGSMGGLDDGRATVLEATVAVEAPGQSSGVEVSSVGDATDEPEGEGDAEEAGVDDEEDSDPVPTNTSFWAFFGFG